MNIKIRKKIALFACVGVLGAVPFALGNTPLEIENSDLTNTKWVFNENVYYPGLEEVGKVNFDVLFFSGSQLFESIHMWYDYSGNAESQMAYYSTDSNDVFVYNSFDSAPWSDVAYQTIYITGGDDVQSEKLLAFLQSNATLVEEEPAHNLDLFDQIYDILNTYLFDGQITQEDMSYKNLMLIAGASVLSFLIIAIPFIAIYAVIRLFFR